MITRIIRPKLKLGRTLFKGIKFLLFFEKRFINFKTSQFRVRIFRKVSIRGFQLRFSVKFYQNFQNTLMFIFLKKKIIKI
jgi:hypothetical protein